MIDKGIAITKQNTSLRKISKLGYFYEKAILMRE